MYTELNDRKLHFDGTSEVSADKILDLLMSGKSVGGLCVNEITDDIKKYNKFANPEKRITTKHDDTFTPNFAWNIPEEYKTLNVEQYIIDRLYEECDRGGWQLNHDHVDVEPMKRIGRTAKELRLYEKMGLYDVLRAMIYIINTLHAKNVVWGVGRGSCVSSYILYLIGVHDVDSVHYDLDITDFLRTDDEEK